MPCTSRYSATAGSQQAQVGEGCTKGYCGEAKLARGGPFDAFTVGRYFRLKGWKHLAKKVERVCAMHQTGTEQLQDHSRPRWD